MVLPILIYNKLFAEESIQIVHDQTAPLEAG